MGIAASRVTNLAVTPESVTVTLSAWMPIGRFLVSVLVNASRAG